MSSFDWGTPVENWVKMPHAMIDALPLMTSMGEIAVILYVLRHTWGFRDDCKMITIDEFEHGRKRNDGSRIDKGTGLSRNSIRDGIRNAVDHGLLEIIEDATDKARIKRYYKLAGGENLTPSDGEKLTPRRADVDPRTEKDTKEKDTKEKDTNTKNQPTRSKIIDRAGQPPEQRLVGFSSEQPTAVEELEEPETEELEQPTATTVGWFGNSTANTGADILEEHQNIETAPPVTAIPPSPVPPGSPPPPVAEAEQSYALLTDDEIGMSRAKAANYANLYSFPWLVEQVATWWQQRADGKTIDGKPMGVGCLCVRLEMEFSPDPIRDDFRRSELYQRYYPLGPELAGEWDLWLEYGSPLPENIRELNGLRPPAWLDGLLDWERAVIEALPAPLGGGG